jgi:hypothetical protein
MQTIRVVAIQCCTIGVNLSWYSRPHEAWRGLGSLVPYCTYSQFKLVIASDLSWKNWTFGIQRQVVASKKRDKAGFTVCCRATFRLFGIGVCA